MIVVVATLAGIGLAALLAMLGHFSVRALNTLDDVRREVSAHDSADRALAEKVNGINQRMDRLETTVNDGFRDLGTKFDGLTNLLIGQKTSI